MEVKGKVFVYVGSIFLKHSLLTNENDLVKLHTHTNVYHN